MKDKGIVGRLGRLTYCLLLFTQVHPHLIPSQLGPGVQHAHLFRIGMAPSQIAPWARRGWRSDSHRCANEYITQGCCPISYQP
jgi:hypothetical protein